MSYLVIEQVLVKVKETSIGYTGWTDVEISKSMDDASTAFSMNTADIGIELKAGDLVEIWYGKKLVTTGFIDTVRIDYSATSHDIQITGRSKIKDLVDCSVKPQQGNKVQQWHHAPISTIISDLVKPFKIKVHLNIEDETIPTFAVAKDGSETVIDCIHRLVNTYQATVTDNEYGDLVITRAGDTKSKISILNNKLDVRSNVLRGSYSDDEQQRFSEVHIRGQGIGTDESFGRDMQTINGTANDTKNISRYRPLIIDSQTPLNATEAKAKANWQIAYNTGKSREFQYTVPGWGDKDNLWSVNSLVDIDDEFMGVKETLLISSIRYSKSSGGTTTDIVLHSADAYKPDPTVVDLPGRKKRKKGKKQTEQTISFEEWSKMQGPNP